MISILRGGSMHWWRDDGAVSTPRIQEFVTCANVRDVRPDMEQPRFTIVTPSYNQGRYIEQTILSVLNQRYSNLEYFIIDGGSTDNSIEVIRKYDRYLTGWVSEPDQGQADAIAKGFQRSTGQVMGWINSDDILLPNALAEAGRAFSIWPELGFAYGHALRCDESTNITDIHCTYPNCYWKIVNRADNVFQGSVFWSRKAYERAGGLETGLSFAMEYPLIHYLMREEAGAFIDAPLAAFRQQPEQKTRTMAEAGRRELEALFGTVELPLRWAVQMFAVRMYHLVRTGNVLRKLQIRRAASTRARDARALSGDSRT